MYQMETKETVIFLFGVFLIVMIVAVLVKIYYTVEHQGAQLQILLKHDKETFVPWKSRAQVQNMSSVYRNQLLPDNKQLTPNPGNMLAINNQRAQRPCQALTTEQLKRYGNEKVDGLAEHATKADELNITTEESLKTGNLSTMDVNVQSNYVEDEGPAIDQTGVIQETDQTVSENFTGNHRINPSFLNSMTPGFKQANESSKERYRKGRKM